MRVRKKSKNNMPKVKMLIGIDPDVDKSGVAFINGTTLTLENLTFFQLFDLLQFYKEKEEKPTVFVECGFLNKSNWHKKAGKSAAFNAKIGEYTGENKQVAKKIVEMCEYLWLPHHKIRPTQKKIDSETFKSLTGSKIRTNQEVRDAFMLIYGR